MGWPALELVESCAWDCGVGRTTEAVSTVFIVGVGLKVTLRPALERVSELVVDGGMRGVLSVAVVDAIEAFDAIAKNDKL